MALQLEKVVEEKPSVNINQKIQKIYILESDHRAPGEFIQRIQLQRKENGLGRIGCMKS